MTTEMLLDPLTTLWESFVNILPGISACIVIFVLGLLVAWIIGKIAKGVLIGTGLDRWASKTKISRSLGGASLSVILSTVLMWWVFIALFAAAVELLNLGTLSEMLVGLARWMPGAIVATIVVVFGLVGADWVANKIRKKEVKGSCLLGDIVKVVIIVFIALIALGQIGIRISLAERTVLVILGGIMLGIAIAIGIGFGKALEKKADKIVKKIQERI